MEIRRFTVKDDLNEVSRVYAASWRAAYHGIVPQQYLEELDDTRWVRFLSKELDCIWIAVQEGCIVGVSTYGPARDELYAGWGEVISIYLLPKHYRKGIGKQLLSASMQSLQELGYDKVCLWVLADNHPSRQFYEACGFRPNGDQVEVTIGGKPLQELRYIFQFEHKGEPI